MRPLLTLLIPLLVFAVFFPFTPAHADDIPDNCEYAQSAEQLALFPRYSASAQRLVLVSWNSGEEVRELAANVQVMHILSWSADCRYLAVAEGTPDVMSTVVYDTTTSQRMGSVDDAHQQPHTITWGTNDALVVETRNGALLWQVPTGQRLTLTDSYNTTTARNFSRLRWDAANNQLIADLAVGGRVVYDLTTGAVVPIATQQLDSRDLQGDAPQVVIGGRSYPCLGSYLYGYRNWYSGNGIKDIRLHYDIQNGLISLELNDIYGAESVIQTLEDDVQASYVVNRGWSPTCRYIAASLGIPGQDASDTVVYDVIDGRRVGAVPDAHQIPHPIQWGSDGKTLLVQTRNGGILWNLETNTQTILNEEAEVPLVGTSSVRNFSASAWTDGQLLAAPVDAPNTVIAYDTQSGEGRTIVTFDRAVKNLMSAPGGWGIAGLEIPGEPFEQQAIFFRLDGNLQVDLGNWYSLTSSSLVVSPDGHYFVLHPLEGLAIWNTTSGTRALYQLESFSNYQFVDNANLRAASGAVLNVETGIYTPPEQPIVNPIRAEIIGQDGTGDRAPWWQNYGYRYDPGLVECEAGGSIVRYDAAQRALLIRRGGDEQVLVSNLNQTLNLAWSPNCDVISGGVSLIGNANVPYDDAPLDDIYRDELSYDVTFWDATTGETLGVFPRPYRYESPARINWSPGGERAFVRTTQGYFIFDPATRQQIPLYYAGPVTQYTAQINTYYTLYWDFSNGRLFVTAWGGALVFDLHTGERIAYLTPNEADGYYNDCQYGGCSFGRSTDGHYLYVYGADSLAQYDFLTLEGVRVDVDNSYSVSRHPTATSPDGRYLVVAYYNVRVWDVANLAEEFTERDPVLTFAGPERRATSIAFVDNTTLAITTYYGEVTYWNVETGQQVTALES